MYDILTFGASIDELNTEAIQQAIDAAASDGGGTVVVPAGEFLTGALFLKSNVELHLSAGAVLKFSDDPKDYPVVHSRWEGVHRKVYASCIYAQNVENISVTGQEWTTSRFRESFLLDFNRMCCNSICRIYVNL